jgi:hypothetical protein
VNELADYFAGAAETGVTSNNRLFCISTFILAEGPVTVL